MNIVLRQIINGKIKIYMIKYLYVKMKGVQLQMINKKTVLKAAAAVSIVFACNITLVAAGNVQPGSAGDPVITLSYFTQEVGKLRTELDSVKTELNSVKTELGVIKEDLKNSTEGNGTEGNGTSGTTKPDTKPETKPETNPDTTKPDKPANLGTAIVKVQILNVRDGAGTTFKKVGVVRLNNKLTLLAQKGDWYQIKYGTVKGWVHGDYIKK